MDEPDLTRAIETAHALAQDLNLRADAAVVLHNSNKLALHLLPCDTVARVAVVGQEVAQFEVDLARRLAALGAPVAELDPRVEPRVHVRNGYAVTLWTHHETVAPQLPPREFAAALRGLHRAMREVDLPSPHHRDRIADALAIVEDGVRSPDLADADGAFLAGRLRDLCQRIACSGSSDQLLHGEPHPGNVLATSGGARFIDLETVCRGPVEFDLAHVPRAVCEFYPGLDPDLLDACRELVLVMVAGWRWDAADQFPNGRRFGTGLLRVLREGPPWPTLDELGARLGL